MKNQTAILIAQEVMDRRYKKPSCYYKMEKVAFKIASYQHFAFVELLNRLYDAKENDPIKIIYDFLYKLSDGKASARFDEQYLMYASSMDAITDVLEIVKDVEGGLK